MGEGMFLRLFAAVGSVYVAYSLAAYADAPTGTVDDIKLQFTDTVGKKEKRPFRRPIIIADSHIINMEDPHKFMPRKKIVIQAPTKFSPLFDDPYPINARKHHLQQPKARSSQALNVKEEEVEDMASGNEYRLPTLTSGKETALVGNTTLETGSNSAAALGTMIESTTDDFLDSAKSSPENDLISESALPSRIQTPVIVTSRAKYSTPSTMPRDFPASENSPIASSASSRTSLSGRPKLDSFKSPLGKNRECRLIFRKKLLKGTGLIKRLIKKNNPKVPGQARNVVRDIKVQPEASDLKYCKWCGCVRKCTREADFFRPYLGGREHE